MRTRRTLRRQVATGGVLIGLAAASGALADVGQSPVKSNPRLHEGAPAASDRYFSWSQNSRRGPGHFNVYEQKFGHRWFRVNPPRTRAVFSAIDGNSLIYDQISHGHRDIYVMDLRTRLQFPMPSVVNSPMGHQWRPTLSANWVEFGRVTAGYYKVYLFDQSAIKLRLLDRHRKTGPWNGLIEPGQVSGNYASWMRCNLTCQVRLYDITTGITTTVPVPRGQYQFGAAVTADGTLYYGQGRLSRCGRGVVLRKLPLGGSPTTLIAFKRGIDFSSTYAFQTLTGTNLYYTKIHCNTGNTDIYRATAP